MDMIVCPRCDLDGAFAHIDAAGDGLLHDPRWCGDPDHCSMHMCCPACAGTGLVKA